MQTDVSTNRPLHRSGPVQWALAGLFLCLLFGVYVFGIWQNPPGFYVDESALSYNGYLVAKTGAGEFGPKFPLFFQVYAHGFEQYSNPTHIYLLAGLFAIVPPSILAARLFAAFWVFAACILLGLLARRISGRTAIGAAVGGMALLTPWLFEISRLVLETFFYPMAVVLLLWSVFRVSEKEKWGWLDVSAIVGSLVLITYSYTIGRLLGPMLAGGLILFAVSRPRIVSVLKVWAVYGLTLIPLIVYSVKNPGVTRRFYHISYINLKNSYFETALNFGKRLLEDINPITMLLVGDINPRHHVHSAAGSFYLAVLFVAVIGIVFVISNHRRNSWWLYVLFGLFASVVPGALTVDSFHTLRMIAYPVFLLMLVVPGLMWLVKDQHLSNTRPMNDRIDKAPDARPAARKYWRTARGLALTALIAFGAVEAVWFHLNFHSRGRERGYAFDAAYKSLYDQAVSQPMRPIYLVDGYWGPAYIHAYWYATMEERSIDEFIHVPYRRRPPNEVLVLSSEASCTDCEIISEEDGFLLYISKEPSTEIQESIGQ